MSEKSPVKIDTAIIDTLKSLKKKWKLSNISEVIDKLMKDRKNIEARIKTIEDRFQTSSQLQPAPVIAPQTEVPKESLSEITEPSTIPESIKVGGQQCDFYTFNDKKQLVECMRKFAEKNEVSRVTQEVCDKCWNIIQSKKEKELKSISETSLITDEQITSDVPLGMPENPEKEAALEKLKEESQEIHELPLPQCNFIGKGYIDEKTGVQFIYCDDPSRKLKKSDKPMCVALTVCQACWKRKEWAKQKREQETEEKAIDQENERIWKEEHPESSHILMPSTSKRPEKTMVDKLNDGTLEYQCEKEKRRYLMKELPCLIDPEKRSCPFKECEKRLMQLIEASEVHRSVAYSQESFDPDLFHDHPYLLSLNKQKPQPSQPSELVEDELEDRRKRMAETEKKYEQTRQKLRKMNFEEYQEWVGHPISQEEYDEMKGNVDT